MANITKTDNVTILAHTAITHPDTLKGTEQNVATKLAASIFCYHSSVEATANTNPGEFYIMTNPNSSGDSGWVVRYILSVNISTADTEAMTATEPVDEKVLTVVATAGFAAKDKLYIQDTGAIANSEWHICQEIVTNTSINLIDGLDVEKDSSDVIWNDADVLEVSIDLTAVKRLRIDFIHEGSTGCNCHVKAMAVYGDSIG